ncbi:YjbH domain-containing protein [Gammaproteobacteria bacterium]|nr:YjbH domain-containing protein [Gammaproteobacteria bacterium]
MYKRTLSFLMIVTSMPSMASDFGVVGLIDIPTARMSQDGTLTTSTAVQSRTKSIAITYQATPWLEGTFRYTGFNNFFHWDRNYEVKVRLWQEQKYLPQVAVGIRDLVGTGIFGAEYLVASKQFGDFDFTLGMGWGRLAGKGDIKNPLTYFSDRFTTRVNDFGKGGTLSSSTFFSGEKAGFFGGLSYQPDALPVSLMLEYNPDQAYWESSRVGGGLRPKSPWSAAVRWQASPGMSLSLSRQHEEEWGIEFSAALDSKSPPSRPPSPVFRSSLDLAQSELPSGINKNSWYDTLLYDVERSGILLLEATIDESTHSATIVMGNTGFAVWTDALAMMADLADLHLPSTVNTLNIVVEEEGYRLQSIRLSRTSLNYGKSQQVVEQEISVEPIKPLSFVQYRTNFFTKKIIYDWGLATRFQFFDPDDPARYQLYGRIGISMALPDDWTLRGAYGQNIYHNFDESWRIESGSVLEHVRSDIVKYLTEGDSGLQFLYLGKRGNIRNDIYYRVFGGVLEEMYSGVGGEVLYQPFQSRLAFGVSTNWVKQRDYDKSFKHLDYQTTTAFASVYWASPFYNYDVALHTGKYLAKDVGSTIEVRRTFNNGWMVGLWATVTDVSAEDFGEGSFDKGMFFKIPLDGLLGSSSGSRKNYSTRLRPIQRDGGQRLENFSGNIWWDTKGARYDAFVEAVTEKKLLSFSSKKPSRKKISIQKIFSGFSTKKYDRAQ